ncbi:MAG: bifunctional pyr operon transcriptional regulator/uracil phosphoribosyltransferase PyrR [Candidatus Eremiobacteraeota bacterium]|nr:bifunctional pyr operon transcriptional regulator/uracil phosphoribosyltransferase PyrR [Candidatus Eremiobacteraeota bacterium]MBC5826435.1 bifunctional pyr operon transcriptional regulator/uracil phosphoribosyltransferase PyrR [Candidatus Eremiobacteraeota bacterium]
MVLSGAPLQRTIERLAHQIVEPNGAGPNLVLVGIRRGGENLTRRIHADIKRRTGISVHMGFLDITLYRDDDAPKIVPDSAISDDLTGKEVVLIDDVLFTGRSARAALDAIIDLGRPQAARLCVLVDRGLRELPIQADYVGRFVPTSPDEHVIVEVRPDVDESDSIVVYEHR